MAGRAWNTAAGGAAKPDHSGGGGGAVRQCDRQATGTESQDRELWRARFTEQGMESLWEVAPGRGRKPTYGAEKIKAIVAATLQTKPQGMTQWSCRLLAASQEVSKSTVSNIWRSHNLKPHRVKSFKLSRDPQFLENPTDVGGSLSKSAAARARDADRSADVEI